jgi:hypothetical protein
MGRQWRVVSLIGEHKPNKREEGYKLQVSACHEGFVVVGDGWMI